MPFLTAQAAGSPLYECQPLTVGSLCQVTLVTVPIPGMALPGDAAKAAPSQVSASAALAASAKAAAIPRSARGRGSADMIVTLLLPRVAGGPDLATDLRGWGPGRMSTNYSLFGSRCPSWLVTAAQTHPLLVIWFQTAVSRRVGAIMGLWSRGGMS